MGGTKWNYTDSESPAVDASPKDKDKKSPDYCNYVYSLIRLAALIACLVFFARGAYISATKYFSQQRAVSKTVKEVDKITFPALTLCSKFKNSVSIVDAITAKAAEKKVEMLDDKLDVGEIIANISYKRWDFLSLFSHPDGGDPRLGIKVLRNDSYWTTSVPHPKESGICYQYRPKFTSMASWWFGMRFGFKFPNSSSLTASEKEALMDSADIFIHDADKLAYNKYDDRPNSNKLDTSWFRTQKEISVSLMYKSLSRLSIKERPCSNDPEYDFNKCVERAYSQRRGCQPPWYYFEEFDIPVCRNVSKLSEDFKENATIGSVAELYWKRPEQPIGELVKTSGCQLPCTTGRFDAKISYVSKRSWLSDVIDGGADWVVYVWFKNFRFEHNSEFLVCDWTCLLGEVGGNLGLFLGGSILAYLDFAYNPVLKMI